LLATSGGFTGGAISFAVVNGTGKGCAIASGALSVSSAGTCIVTAREAANATNSALSSAPTTIILIAKVVAYPGRITVTFAVKSDKLSTAAKQSLLRLVTKLVVGDSVTCAGYAKKEAALARSRAVVVANFLTSRIKVHVRLESIINVNTNRTTVATS
jgi:hypothetical protein